MDVLLTLCKHNEQYKAQYKDTKKVYDNLLRAERSEMYDARIKSSDNKTKCMWTICNEILGKENKNNDIGVKGDPSEISNQYNTYLLSIIPELLSKLESRPFNCNIKANQESMYLKPITPAELCEFANQIKNKQSSGIDEIPTCIIKIAVPQIKEVLCYLINNSFKQGMFPDQLKVALIKPLHKKGSPAEIENYRPISLLPGFSKLFELAMCKRIVNFFNKCKLFNSHQHGYIAGKSTQTAIFEFTKAILRHLEVDGLALGFCLDLSKAYDSIDKELLVRKLELYGIRGNSLRLFNSYLSERKQKVKITRNGVTFVSDVMENKLGIAQGSIAGPVLFIIFVNDLYSIADTQNKHITCYADDTNLIIGDKNMTNLIEQGAAYFVRANEWFTENKLILNREKTNVIMFSTKLCRFQKPPSLNVLSEDMEVAGKTKFLGLTIDEFLDWSEHMHILLNKLNSVCYGIRIVGRYMSEKTQKMMYFANFQSVLKYGIIFWGKNGLMDKVFVTQKRVIRSIKKMQFRESCRGVFKVEGILTVYALYIYEALVFFFKNRESFERRVFHGYNTRTINVNYPIHRLTLTERSPYYMCLRLFNHLPYGIKSMTSQRLFKNSIKRLLIDLEPYSLSDFLG